MQSPIYLLFNYVQFVQFESKFFSLVASAICVPNCSQNGEAHTRRFQTRSEFGEREFEFGSIDDVLVEQINKIRKSHRNMSSDS